jgi:hypothetical protein
LVHVSSDQHLIDDSRNVDPERNQQYRKKCYDNNSNSLERILERKEMTSIQTNIDEEDNKKAVG